MSTFGDLLKYLKIYRRYLGRRMYLLFTLAVATALSSAFGIALLLPLLKASQVGGGTESMGWAEQKLYDLLGLLGIADSMVGILAFIAVVFVGKGLLAFAKSTYQGYLQAQLLRELKTQLFDAYTGMDYRYYIQQNAGHFINVINQQVNRFFQSFSHFVGFFSQLITTTAYFATAFAITWKFSAMALAVGAGLLFLFRYLNVYVRRLSRKRSEEMSHLNKFLVQSLQAFKYVVSTNQTRHLRDGVVDSVKRLTDYIFRQRAALALTSSIREPVSVLLIVSLIMVQVAIFEGPVAPIFVALLFFHRGMQAVLSVQTSWQNTMDKIGSVEMVDDEFDAVLENQEQSGARRPGPLREGIELRNVHFAYNEADGDALRDINIEIPVSKTVALVGESGAGKSTLVDLLTLMLKPRSGTVRIDGVPHDEVDLTSWRDQIGYVSQETVIFDDTVANNICLWQGDIEEDPALRGRVSHAAERARAHRFIEELPNGYQTVVGDRGIRLSGGQRQRLFVARELFKEPNLLLLDEATSDLDAASEQHIQDSIDVLKGEVTVVIIAHRLSTIKDADRILVLDQGRVIERGNYEELRMREDGEFKEMVDIQSL
ncbi:ABC-type multidrug transport system fused ATPase/permease subunit [Salinibacter ruber]|uniref:ABC transporter ATP-binding protein n=1 Tax=Salinibacter ruber TaxID=146919 RepID=UPI0021686C40|nr:ABC transporter ATP-binding protein [Salinibacter ruber]MCS4194445.1 ABC-type multidrug transport system fused ATPase/permease subunit [Salinibacter ruber]